MAVSGRCSGGRGVCQPLATWGCDWHAVNDTMLAYGQLLVDDPARIGPIQATGMDQTLFNRVGSTAPSSGRPFDSPKTRRAIGRRDRVAQGDEQASRWPTGESWVRTLEIGTGVGDRRGVQLQRLCVCPTSVRNSNACAGAEQVCEVGRGQRTRSDAVRGPERYQDDRDRMCRRITEQTTRGFAFRNAHLWRTLQTPDEPRVWLAARRVTR